MSLAAELNETLTALQQITSDFDGLEVSLYDGTFTDSAVKNLTLNTPAILLSCVSARPTSTAINDYVTGQRGPDGTALYRSEYSWRTDAAFALAVLTADTLTQSRVVQAWAITDAINPILFSRAAREPRWQNAYSQALYDQGLFMLSLSWRVFVESTPAEAARFTPASVQTDHDGEQREVYPS